MSESSRESSRRDEQVYQISSSSQLLNQQLQSVKKSQATFHPALDAKKEFPTKKIATIVLIVLLISICIAAALVPIYISFGYDETDLDSYFDFNANKADIKSAIRPSPEMMPPATSNFQIPAMMPLPPPSDQLAPSIPPPQDFQQLPPPSQPSTNSTMLKKLRKLKLHRHKKEHHHDERVKNSI